MKTHSALASAGLLVAVLLLLSLPTAALAQSARHVGCQPPARDAGAFTLAVIPDTQNYLDYTHQIAAGFPFDAHTMLDRQLKYVARHARSNGGDIAFVSAVGDVWQHQSLAIDPDSGAKGYSAIFNPWLAGSLSPTPFARSVELPGAELAYDQIAGRVPFGVVPGNHDYDAMYSDSRWVPTTDVTKLDPSDPNSIGELHIGGLDNFRQVFGSSTSYFKGKRWYVATYNGGADSAQVFHAGGYTFLHIGLEMDAPDGALTWAARILAAHRGMPTILTTHDYLNTDATRTPNPIIDPKLTDPSHNDPQDLWTRLISKHDQIFLVLCGHEHGEAYRVDKNAFGHNVYQVLADYQDRSAVSLEKGSAKPVTLGDGWLRLMAFRMANRVPSIHVRTYSTYYGAYSTALPQYASLYKSSEAPTLSNAAFLAKGDFTINLVDFRARFGEHRHDGDQLRAHLAS